MIPLRFKLTCMVVILAVANHRAFADGDAVSSPAKRQEILDKGKKLLATHDTVPVAIDPFHSEQFAEMLAGPSRAPVAVNVVVAPRSEKEILQAIATSMKPTGNFVLSGEPTLVFGQKRVKAGGFVTIPFEGKEYTLEITAIERTSFTLRLNREEFTRPIK